MILRKCFVFFFFLWTYVDSASVMSVDLGTEWFKVAVVSPGVPMEIALNVETKRKTATIVSLRDGERTFGSEALSNCVKYPKTCYAYFLELIGKTFDNPVVKDFQSKFPYYELKEDPVRGTVLFVGENAEFYSPQELLAMVLSHARTIAEDYAGQKPIKDVVLTVPAFFNEAERRAILEAGKLSGLNVLQLISEPMAVALNYGMFRRKEIMNETAKNLMFYDMGATDTTVSIVSFSVVKTKEYGFTETHPQAQILGIGYDRTLGGLSLQLSLRDFLASEFEKKTSKNVRSVPRAMGKLFKEAERAKNILSANNDLYAQIENVMDDIDFKVHVTRAMFQDMNKEFFERVLNPVTMALRNAGDMKKEEISEVILVGAGTRVPKIQEILTESLGIELGKNMNTDESAAMGAVYKAADLSSGFKVKKFITKEAVIFPIDVDFERQYEDENNVNQLKKVKRSLFSRSNSFPQKKIMTFNKFEDDFVFNVNVNDIDFLDLKEQSRIGGFNLSTVEVKGLAAVLKNHTEPNVESKGVKAHFQLDESGLLSVTSVECVFEKTISVEEQLMEQNSTNIDKDEIKKEGENSWAKLGESISSFFGDMKDGEDGKENNLNDKKGNKTNEKKEAKKEEKKVLTPKIETIKESLEYNFTILYMPPLTEEAINVSKARLHEWNEKDAVKKAHDIALNSLETFVINMRDNLYQEIYEKSSTEEERTKINEKLTEVADWIEEEVGPATDKSLLDQKLKELKELTASLSTRVHEHLSRPEELETLNNILNASSHFLQKAQNNAEINIFTAKELELLEKKVTLAYEWKLKSENEQELQPMSEMPKLTVNIIREKGMELEREVSYLVNKAKIAIAEREREKKRKEKEEAEKKKKEAEKKKKKKKKKKESNNTLDEVLEEEVNSETTDENAEPVNKNEESVPSEPVTNEEHQEANSEKETKNEESDKTEDDHVEL